MKKTVKLYGNQYDLERFSIPHGCGIDMIKIVEQLINKSAVVVFITKNSHGKISRCGYSPSCDMVLNGDRVTAE